VDKNPLLLRIHKIVQQYEKKKTNSELRRSFLRWVEYLARMGRKRQVYRPLVWKYEQKDYLECLGVYGKIILKCTCKRMEWIKLV